MPAITRDLRHAFRRLWRTPAFTAIALVSLALGIGANTAIFSLIHAVVLRPSAVAAPDRVLEVFLKSNDYPFSPFSIPDYRDFETSTRSVFSGSLGAAFTLIPRDLGDRVESLPAEMVTGEYFTTQGIRPHLGRLLGPEDDVSAGAHAVTVLSHDYWRKSFAGDPGVVGRNMRINGRDFTIVGVAPADYDGMLRGIPPAVYVPITMINQLQPSQYDQLQQRGDHSTFVRARLAEGVTLPQAKAALNTYLGDMKTRFREWPSSATIETVPLSDVIVSPIIDKFIVLAAGLLIVVVGLVLLIACANLASFLLAQARDRQREIAIRLAIGASRSGLVRQLLTESVALAVVGGFGGIVLAKGMLATLLNADLPLPLPIEIEASLNFAVLLYALAISVVAGLLFGLAPALQASRADVITTIKSENAGGGPRKRFTLRGALVVGQVAVSLVLLVTAGLLLRSLQARQMIDPGFGQEPTALIQFAVSSERYNDEQGRLHVKKLEAAASELPGVQAVGLTGNIHLNTLNTQNFGIQVEGFQPPPGQDYFLTDFTRVNPGFFGAAGIPIVRGRNFDDGIDRAGTPLNVIINEVMAERFWSGQDPIGRTFRSGETVYTIVGVARNAKIRTPGEDPRMFVYSAYSQSYTTLLTMLIRTTGDAERTLVQAMSALRSVDPDLMIIDTKTMTRHLAVMLLPAQLAAVVFGAFAALALTLAIIGVYGVVSYAVARRTREVGIRMSLGANPREVVTLMMGQGLGLVAIGGVIGIAIALLASRVLQSLLYGVGTIDPLTFGAVPALLLVVGGTAAYLPARRASRVDPARVLTSD